MSAHFWLGSGGVHTFPHLILSKFKKRICPCKVYFSILLNVFVKCMLSFNWAREEGTPLSHLEEHTSEPEWACCLPGAGIWRENVKTQQPSLTTDTLNCFTLALPSEGRRVAEPAWHIIEKGLTTVNWWVKNGPSYSICDASRVDIVSSQIVKREEHLKWFKWLLL